MMQRRFSGFPLRDLQTYRRGRAVRLPESDYASEEILHITMCAATGKPFRRDAVAKMVCDSIERCCELNEYRLYGYCVMPDHVHVLLSPGESGVPLKNWLRAFKSYTGHAFGRLGGSPPLWQRSAYDHICRKCETVQVVLEYIANNPIRAGLVTCWRDWRWTRVFVEI
jgi:REP element-mobilizing transposase RayT